MLARAKRRVAQRISSAAYLSAGLLGGLLLNALLGWWWADPVAAFVLVPIIAKEGIDAIRVYRARFFRPL